MIPGTDHVTLTPELERFAAEAIATDRDVSEVVRAGLSLLKEAEAEVADFVASLDEAQAEGERDVFFDADEVERRVRAAIADVAARRDRE